VIKVFTKFEDDRLRPSIA